MNQAEFTNSSHNTHELEDLEAFLSVGDRNNSHRVTSPADPEIQSNTIIDFHQNSALSNNFVNAFSNSSTNPQMIISTSVNGNGNSDQISTSTFCSYCVSEIENHPVVEVPGKIPCRVKGCTTYLDPSEAERR